MQAKMKCRLYWKSVISGHPASASTSMYTTFWLMMHLFPLYSPLSIMCCAAIPRSRGRQRLKAITNSKDNQENKKQSKCSELAAGCPFIPDSITPLVQSPPHLSKRAPLRQLKCGPSQATLTTSTPVTMGGAPKGGPVEQGTRSPPISPSFSAHDCSELQPSSEFPSVSLSWDMVESVDDPSIRQYHSQLYDTRRKRGKKGSAKQQQKRRKSV